MDTGKKEFGGMELRNQLCFVLYVCSKEVIRQYKKYLDPFNLTFTQYIVLAALWEKDGISITELGKVLYLDSGTLTPLLRKMEDQEFITRRHASGNFRDVIVRLTDYGRDLREKLADIPDQVCCSAKVSPTKKEILLTLLRSCMEQI